jgi:lipopolysaccharide cholinephosphotransferase
MSNPEIREHQLVLLELLREFDRICSKYSISYMLFAGSALGAVRHGGFIPWDDDLDVILLRPDYERFLRVAADEISESYFLQAEYSAHWPMFFSKLRKNGTACMEKFVPKDRLQHQGVYIDIFPADNLSDHWLVARLQFASSKIVIAKALDRRGYLTDSLRKKMFMRFCRLLPLKPFAAFTQGRRLSGSSHVHSFFGASSSFRKSVYPRAWFQETQLLPFEDGLFSVSCHADELLTTLYGDYMTPSPPEVRAVKVHGALVDLHHSYEDYLDWQAAQHYTTYTRSIR